MENQLTFHFEGALADIHRLNFYEAARFQYAAARLMVKLARFRLDGTIFGKIYNSSNVDIRLTSQTDGSFNVNADDNSIPAIDSKDSANDDDDNYDELYISVSLRDLIAYVSDMLIEKVDINDLAAALSSDGIAVISRNGETKSEDAEAVDSTVLFYIKNRRAFDGLTDHTQNLLKRRAAEIFRENRITEIQAILQDLSLKQSQQLASMAAPLLKEMSQNIFNRSAKTFEIWSSSHERNEPLLYLDKSLAKTIEVATIDDEPIGMLCDVIQFNKDSGWGKIKIEQGKKILRFNVPRHILSDLKQLLIDRMKQDLVYLEVYPVRDRSRAIKRLVVVSILQDIDN